MKPIKDYIVIDVETSSGASLQDIGTSAYVNHPSTEILCVSWILGDGTEALLWEPSLPLDALESAILKADRLVAHNIAFDRGILVKFFTGLAAINKRFDAVLAKLKDFSVWNCTMARCNTYRIPASLKAAAKYLKLKNQKMEFDLAGISYNRKPTKSNPVVRYTPHDHPKLYRDLYEYCKQDILTTLELHKTLPNLHPF